MNASLDGARQVRRTKGTMTGRLNGFEVLMFSLLAVGLIDCVILAWLVVHSL
jgi:hypothetical protein